MTSTLVAGYYTFNIVMVAGSLDIVRCPTASIHLASCIIELTCWKYIASTVQASFIV